MINNDEAAVVIQCSKLVSRTRCNHEGLSRMLRFLHEYMHNESSKPIDSGGFRSKYEILLARKTELIERLNCEFESLQFGNEDAYCHMVYFYNDVVHYRYLVGKYLQEEEIQLVLQKHKWKHRVQPFTALILDDIMEYPEETTPMYRDRYAVNETIYFLRHTHQLLINGEDLSVSLENEFIKSLQTVFDSVHVLIKYHSTALLVVACQCFLTSTEKRSNRKGNANQALQLISMLLPVSCLTMKSLLVSEDEINESNRSSVEKDLLLLLPLSLTSLRYMLAVLVTLSLDDSLVLAWRKVCFEESCRFLRYWIGFFVTLGYSASQPTPFPAQSMCEDLLASSLTLYRLFEYDENHLQHCLPLAKRVADRAAARVGAPGQVNTFSVRETSYFAPLDKDLIVSADVVAGLFGRGLVPEDALSVLQALSTASFHRCHSYFVSTAFVKCLLAGAILCVDSAGDSSAPPATDKLRRLLACNVERLLVIWFLHRNTLSLSHKSMLTLRYLLRELFFKRVQVEELMAKDIASLADPFYAELMRVRGDNEDEEEQSGAAASGGVGYADEGERLQDALSAHKQQKGSHQSTAGGGKKDANVSVDAEMKEIITTKLPHSFHGDSSDTSAAYTAIPEMLQFMGENYVQQSEVFEQTLLLSEHIAVASQLCKYLLVDAGLSLIIQRYLDSMPSNAYMVALAEITLEALEL